MIKKYRITLDKIKETSYHFHNLFDIYDKIISEKNIIDLIKYIRIFRYELNSFVNSFRATTFNLQKECRNKEREKFDKWYEKAIKELINDDFGQIIKELRNINQKEGNIYPTFIFQANQDGRLMNWESDLHNPDMFAKGFSIGNVNATSKKTINSDVPKENIFGSPEFMEKNNFSEMDLDIILRGLAEATNQMMSIYDSNSEFTLKKICIDRFEKEYEPEEFMKNIKILSKKLEKLYLKAEEEL